jgi:hypothetical protein
MMGLQASREHRWSRRQAVETGLRIYTIGQQSWPGQMRDLSIGGVFAKIEAKALSPNDPVDVAFVLYRGDEATQHRLPARVIWVAPDGAGCMFTDFRQETLQVLRAALRADIGVNSDKDADDTAMEWARLSSLPGGQQGGYAGAMGKGVAAGH